MEQGRTPSGPSYSTKVEPVTTEPEELPANISFPAELGDSPLVANRPLLLASFHELMKERADIMWNVEKGEKTIKPEDSKRGHRGTLTHQGYFFQQVDRTNGNQGKKTEPPFEGYTRWDQFQAIWVHLSEIELNDFAPAEEGKGGDLQMVRHTYETPERYEALQFATNDYMGRVDVLEHFKQRKLFVVHVLNKKLPSIGFVDFCLAVKSVPVSDTEWYCVICSVNHPKCEPRRGVKRAIQLGSVLWIKDKVVRYTLALKDERVNGCMVRCLGGSSKVDQILLTQYWEGQEEAFVRMAKFDASEHQREKDQAAKDEKKAKKKQERRQMTRRASLGVGTQMAIQM